jgi:YjbE family integral membrane protein
MDLFSADVLSGLLTIVLLDLVLAGDNAIVIALAARNLPAHLQKKAIFWGTFGAIGIRVALTAVVIYLLRLPGLMLVGGLVLLPIAWKLLRSEEHDPGISPAAGFWAAIRTIVVADALMGLDNVLAIAGAAKGHMGLVIVGLAISVPLVVWGSTLILKLIERFPVVVYIGAAAVAWTASRMIAHDNLLQPWFVAHPWATWTLDAMFVGGICGGGWMMQKRRTARRST